MKRRINGANIAKLSGLGLIIMWIVMNRDIAANMRCGNDT